MDLTVREGGREGGREGWREGVREGGGGGGRVMDRGKKVTLVVWDGDPKWLQQKTSDSLLLKIEHKVSSYFSYSRVYGTYMTRSRLG